MIRARCGNRLMDAPQAQISLLEPPEDVFNAPELPLISLLSSQWTIRPPAPPGEITPEPVAAVAPPVVVPPVIPPVDRWCFHRSLPPGWGFLTPPPVRCRRR